MIRRIRLVTPDREAALFNYYARNPRFIGLQRVLPKYDPNIGVATMPLPIAFPDCIKLGVFQAGAPGARMFDFYVEVDENQPKVEAVEETSQSKSSLTVYNDNDVVICDNGVTVTVPTSSPSSSTTAPGEMTSVPGEEPGEMTSEPIGVPGETV